MSHAWNVRPRIYNHSTRGKMLVCNVVLGEGQTPRVYYALLPNESIEVVLNAYEDLARQTGLTVDELREHEKLNP